MHFIKHIQQLNIILNKFANTFSLAVNICRSSSMTCYFILFCVLNSLFLNVCAKKESFEIEVDYALIPNLFIYLSTGFAALSIICFFSFVSAYTVYSGCPARTQRFTEVWRVDRSEQLHRFQMQKKKEILMRERDRRKFKEVTQTEEKI
ncbi:hypothetical protein M3Y97_00155600 [Aphelenchoides bicaudatus]|nr:hypothetical protein M3Y97_00155600 [Aphelenchoides bicaudatus]